MEDTTVAASQADTDDTTTSTSQVDDTTTSTPSPADESHDTNSSKPSESAEDYKRMIAELRKENARHRTRLKTFEEEEAKRVEAQLTEQQRLQKQYEDLKTQHDEFVQAQTERAIQHEVGLQAAKLGVNPKHLDRVARFIDWEEIETDDTGSPTNIPELLGQLIKDMPELLTNTKASMPTSGGATNPPRSSTSGQSSAKSYIDKLMQGKLSSEEYNGLPASIKEDIQKAMSGRMKLPVK